MYSRLKAGVAGLVTLCCIIPGLLSAQRQSDNIVLETGIEEFTFHLPRKGQADFTVMKSVRNSYRCREISAAYRFREDFIENSELSDFSVYTDDSKRRDIQPEFSAGESRELFQTHRRCELTIPFSARGADAQLHYRHTFRDPRSVAIIPFSDDLPVKRKTIIIRTPEWLDLRVSEWNFSGAGISKSVDTVRREIIHTYTITNYNAPEALEKSPSYYQVVPHLVLEYRTARIDEQARSYFPGTGALYAHCRSFLDTSNVVEPEITSLAQTITAGIKSDREKVRALFHWVQNNVRYIAFEDGIAGLRPDKASSVVRKKYADCKGMSALLVSMMRSLGLEAAHCWIGTNDLPYDFRISAMCITNHMIAAWIDGGKPVYLDATANWVAFGEQRSDVQGKHLIRENGTGYALDSIPFQKPEENLHLEQRTLTLVNVLVSGTVKHTLRGQSKHEFLNLIHTLGKSNTADALRMYVSAGSAGYAVSDIVTSDLRDRDADLTISYHLEQPTAMNAFDDDVYLDLDNRRHDIARVDSSRQLPLQESHRLSHRLEIALRLPKPPLKSNFPAPLRLDRAGYRYDAGWILDGGTLRYHSSLELKDATIPVSAFKELNADFEGLRKFYASQPEFRF